MTLGLRGILVCLVLATLAGVAFAEEGDVVLDRYDLALDSLRRSVTSLQVDRSMSLEYLELARATLGRLAEGTTSPRIVTALEQTHGLALQAVQNQSATDLSVQVSVLAGGLRRFVYEAALREAAAGNADLARDRILHIAADMGLEPGAVESLEAVGTDLDALRIAFEAGIIDAARIRLDLVQAGLEEGAELDVERSYRWMAQAYAYFIPVQDSPRAAESINTSFQNVITSLVDGDVETLPESVAGLSAEFEAFERAVAAARGEPLPEQEAGPDETTETGVVVGAGSSTDGEPLAAPVVEPAEAPAETSALSIVEAVVAPVQAAPAAAAEAAPVAAPAVESAANTVAMDAAQTPPAVTPAPTSAATALPASAESPAAQAAPEAAAPVTPAVERELAAYGVDAATLRQLVSRYAEANVGSVAAALDTLRALNARAVGALSSGDAAAASARVAEYGAAYTRLVAPLVNRRDAALDTGTRETISSLTQSPALRLQDLAALAERTERIADVVAPGRIAADPALGFVVGSAVTSVWSGIVRAVAVLAVALLSFLPLVLLRMAFSGGNRNWQWIGGALWLLLLPVIYEGLGFAGAMLAAATGIPALGVLATYSIFQNNIAHLVWVTVTTLGVLFASVGLYGICVQFGLLGRRNDPKMTAVAGGRKGSTDKNSIEWDEEF